VGGVRLQLLILALSFGGPLLIICDQAFLPLLLLLLLLLLLCQSILATAGLVLFCGHLA